MGRASCEPADRRLLPGWPYSEKPHKLLKKISRNRPGWFRTGRLDTGRAWTILFKFTLIDCLEPLIHLEISAELGNSVRQRNYSNGFLMRTAPERSQCALSLVNAEIRGIWSPHQFWSTACVEVPVKSEYYLQVTDYQSADSLVAFRWNERFFENAGQPCTLRCQAAAGITDYPASINCVEASYSQQRGLVWSFWIRH